jgi:hypothetical protein
LVHLHSGWREGGEESLGEKESRSLGEKEMEESGEEMPEERRGARGGRRGNFSFGLGGGQGIT